MSRLLSAASLAVSLRLESLNCTQAEPREMKKTTRAAITHLAWTGSFHIPLYFFEPFLSGSLVVLIVVRVIIGFLLLLLVPSVHHSAHCLYHDRQSQHCRDDH